MNTKSISGVVLSLIMTPLLAMGAEPSGTLIQMSGIGVFTLIIAFFTLIVALQ